jgi:hypothetical protein
VTIHLPSCDQTGIPVSSETRLGGSPPRCGCSASEQSERADEVRGRMRQTAQWHYVDVPLDESKYDSRFSGEPIACVVDKASAGSPWESNPPGLPQIRACPIRAPGSSCHVFAAGRHTEWIAIAGGSG